MTSKFFFFIFAASFFHIRPKMRLIDRHCFVIVLIIILFCSCSQNQGAFNVKDTPHHYDELKAIRDLMIDHPEQALHRIHTLDTSQNLEQWSPTDLHELRILSTEAAYKTGNLSENRYSLDLTVPYFDSLSQCFPKDLTTAMLLAKAYYYLGVENAYHQNDVNAVSNFVSALETINTFHLTNDPLQTRFKGLCHYRLGEILYDYNLQASALSAFDSAQVYFDRVQDTLGVAACIRSVGEVYQGNKDYERALAKFKEANKLWNFGDELYDHAIGGMYYEHDQYDSACVYLERSFLTGGPYARIDASAKLAEIWKQRGVKEKEDYYTLFYVQNAIRETNRSSDKMEIEFILDAGNQKPSVEPPRFGLSKLLIPLLILAAIIAIMAYIIIHNRHRISSIEQQLSTLEQKHREENKDKDQQIQTISKELNDAKQRLERRRQVTSIDLGNALDAYLKAPATLKIKKSVQDKDIMTKSVGLYPNLKLSEMDFIEIINTANTCFPDFSAHFLQDHSELSTVDLRHCCLALMGLNDAEIAVMEGITYSGANRRTKRILSVMGSESGLEETILIYLKDLYK